MRRTSLAFLFRSEAPFVHVGPGEEERCGWIPGHFYSCDGIETEVRLLRGRKMRSVESLMDEFAAAFQFFDGFGENWNALEECLCYLDEWMPADGYVAVIEAADMVLGDEPAAVDDLLVTLRNVAAFWQAPIDDGDRFDRPARPFHFLMHVADDSAVGSARLVDAAARAGLAIGYSGDSGPQ